LVIGLKGSLLLTITDYRLPITDYQQLELIKNTAMTKKKTRRAFLATSIGMAGTIVGCGATKRKMILASSKSAANATMPERLLGSTGVKLPILGLGGAGQTPLSAPNAEDKAVVMIQRAFELGIRYFDTAADYGPSEDYLGKVVPSFRDKIFLATKTAMRDRDTAWRELEKSLKRLKTDYLDLWQLHHVSFESELDKIFSRDGAIRALEEAKQQKLVRFVGITGHHEPGIIALGLQRYAFDTALIPVNAADKHHPRPFIPKILPLAQQKNIGIIAMKVPAYGRLFKPGVLDGMHQALGYTLSQPGVHCAVIAAETVEQLASNVKVAQAFQPLDETTIAAIEKRTLNAWQDNSFYRAWT
jgi:aryl-alcohol dehydrogenase-like predicted oxidoreductase